MKTREELEAENARLRKEYQNSDQDNMRLQQALDAERGQSNARLQKWQRSEKENARLVGMLLGKGMCPDCGHEMREHIVEEVAAHQDGARCQRRGCPCKRAQPPPNVSVR